MSWARLTNVHFWDRVLSFSLGFLLVCKDSIRSCILVLHLHEHNLFICTLYIIETLVTQPDGLEVLVKIRTISFIMDREHWFPILDENLPLESCASSGTLSSMS